MERQNIPPQIPIQLHTNSGSVASQRTSGSMLRPQIDKTGNTEYCSTDQVFKGQGQPAFDETKEGIRRLSDKYASPANVLMPQGIEPKAGMNGLPVPGGPQMSSAMSDASSDVSDATPTWPSSVNMASNFSEGLTEQDILQVEMFYRGHKTEVHVCKCLANLYFGSAKNSSSEGWDFAFTGVPVLLLDTGDHHRQRRLAIILAEKGTGFVLWRDLIDHLTKYSSPHQNFHTLHLSTDHSRLAGFSFDDNVAASEFYGIMSNLTSDPDDTLLSLSKSKKGKKKDKASKQKYKAPKKTDISQPCCFVHVTKLERPQIPPPPSSASSLSDVMNEKLELNRSESSELSEGSSSYSASEH